MIKGNVKKVGLRDGSQRIILQGYSSLKKLYEGVRLLGFNSPRTDTPNKKLFITDKIFKNNRKRNGCL